MKNLIALAQLNPKVGDVEYNKNKVIESIKKAEEKGANLIIFPELFLIGYPMGDILTRYPYIANQQLNALDEIKEYCKNITALIGFSEINKNKFGKPYYNSAALINNKKIEKIIRKTLLPNYSEHNDYRYFESYKADIENRIFNLNGINYGVAICEDAWNDFDFFEKNLYKIDPINEIASKIDVLLCLSSSCSRAKKEQLKHNMMKFCALKYNIKYVYVNQVGANDELVYDGLSRIYNEKGELIFLSKEFKEDLAVFDLDKTDKSIDLAKDKINLQKKEFSLNYEADLDRTYKSIVLAISEYFSKNNFKRAVLGLSGGLDSTVCAVLLADSLGKENVLGVSMPSKITTDESRNDAKILAKNLGINFLEVPIKTMQGCIKSEFENIFYNVSKNWNSRYENSFTNDNIQARLRGMVLWGIANEYASTLPIATSDKSELYMGYATINGDMSGGYAPIADVVKTKLFSLARWMNKNRKEKDAIPTSIIEKPPGAELAINPKTNKPLLAEEALMPYEFLDEVIWRIENLNQSINNMMQFEFLYEKKNVLDKNTKLMWLEKFFKRLNTALYKWYIVPPYPIIDSYSINKIEFKQPIVSNINYSK